MELSESCSAIQGPGLVVVQERGFSLVIRAPR